MFFTGIIILVLGLVFLIIDGVRTPKWQMASAIGRWLNNRIVRRILRILLIIAITVGSLFIIATIGFLGQSRYPDNTGLMWLTLLPIIAAMIVIWICLISAGALESVARGVARLFGFQISGQPNLTRSWGKGFLSAAFWIYLILVFYPFWNPWTGNLHPALMIGLLFGGMALATYARWAAGAGKKSKIFGLVIVPLLFMYCLGAKYPKEFSFLGALVNRGRAKTELKQAGMNLDSTVDDRKTKSKEEAIPVIKNIRLAELQKGIAPLDADGNEITLEDYEKGLVRIERTMSADKLKTIAPKLIDYLNPAVNTEFHEIKLKDAKGRYSSKSRTGYIEITDKKREVIDIPEVPEINDLNKRPKSENNPILTVPLPSGGYKKIITLSSSRWSEKITLPMEADFLFAGHPDALVKFDNGTIGPITESYGIITGNLRFKGPDGEKVTVQIVPTR